MVAATAAVVASGYKWLHGWQQHERLVAEGKATPVGRRRLEKRSQGTAKSLAFK
jgi:hypothetical protein